jgi:lipopolysaccharide export system protein LptA
MLERHTRLLAAFALLGCAAAAQTVRSPQVTLRGGFTAPLTDGDRLVALVSGKEARPALLAGQFGITEFRLETFRYAPERETELVVESPESTFDPNGARSEHAISLRSADGRFDVAGEGWSWEQSTGLLVISNKVRTSVRRAGTPTNQPPIEITARRLEYNLKNGETRFLDDCVAVEPGSARIEAGALFSRLGVREERPDQIIATNGVVLEWLRSGQTGKAMSATAIYLAGEQGEEITLSGAPAWEFGGVRGSARELVLYPARESYRAHGEARMLLETGLLTGRQPLSSDRGEGSDARGLGPAETSSVPLEIACETIEARPGEVVFSGPVTARQDGGIDLSARRVVAQLSSAPGAVVTREAVHRLEANGDVQAVFPVAGVPLRLSGDSMLYSVGEHALIEVSGEPAWQSQGYTGRARHFVIQPEVPAFQALGGVNVQWMMTRQDSDPDPAPMSLEAESMRAEAGQAHFLGGVSMRREGWDLQAGEVDLILTNTVLRGIMAREGVTLEYISNQMRSTNSEPVHALARLLRDASESARRWVIKGASLRAVLAPDGVALESLDAEGGVTISHRAVEASGGRLSYRATDGVLRLHDAPWLRSVDGLQIVGEKDTTLAMNPQSGTFAVEGAVRRMSFPAKTLTGRTPKAPLDLR